MSVTLAVISAALLAVAVIGYFDMKRYVKKMDLDAPVEKYKKALIIRVVVVCSALVAVSVLNLVSIILRWV